MGERPVYHYICKLYVDGDYMGLSSVLADADRWTLLFDKGIRSGACRVEIVHGCVQDGQWDDRMPEQPERFYPVVEARWPDHDQIYVRRGVVRRPVRVRTVT